MSGVPLETCWAFNKLWNNKFYYKAASCWYFYWVIYDARIHEYRNQSGIIYFTMYLKTENNLIEQSVIFWPHVRKGQELEWLWQFWQLLVRSNGAQPWKVLENVTVQGLALDDKHIDYKLLVYFTRLYVNQAQESQCRITGRKHEADNRKYLGDEPIE